MKTELKKDYYYYIFCNNKDIYNNTIIKYLGDNRIRFIENKEERELNEEHTSFADKKHNGKVITYSVKISFREVEINREILENLGFLKEGREYQKKENFYILPIYRIEELKDGLGFMFLGYDIYRSIYEYKEKEKKSNGIFTINELFDRLEKEGMVIEDKDNIVYKEI